MKYFDKSSTILNTCEYDSLRHELSMDDINTNAHNEVFTNLNNDLYYNIGDSKFLQYTPTQNNQNQEKEIFKNPKIKSWFEKQ